MPPRRQVGGEVYRSDDGGETWVKQNKQPVGGTPAYYYGQIRIDPNNENQIYVLSIPLYKSSDGGKTWSNTGARSVHVDHHALWIDPRNSKHLILGNDGGFHFSYDQATTWDYVFNLPLSQFYAIHVDTQQPYHVYGGLQDNGTFAGPSRSRNFRGIGRFEWHHIGGGDGFYVQVHRRKPNLVILESQFGVINRIDRQTGSRKSIRPPQPKGEPRHRYNWNSPIVASHHDDNTVYFGAQKLFKTTDFGDKWEAISGDLTTNDPVKIAGNVPHCTITTIAESPLDAKVLLVGTDDGKVQSTDDGGKTWTDLSGRFPLRPGNWWCTRVELSHHDINKAYCTFSGYREDDFRPFVFATSDRGKTWQPLSSGLPEGPANVIKEDRYNASLLYLGTDFAVHVSLDRGMSWLPLGQLPRTPVHDLVVHPRERDLVIGTHGRGIFATNVRALQELTAQALQLPATLFSIRSPIRWRFRSTQSIWGDRRAMTPNPPNGAVISYMLSQDVDAKKISLTIVDKANKTVAKLPVKNKAGLYQTVWDLRGQSRNRRGGPPVSGNEFTAVLRVNDREHRQSIKILPDPIGTTK